MLISFDCPRCLKIARGEVTRESREVLCPHCFWSRPVAEGDLQAAAGGSSGLPPHGGNQLTDQVREGSSSRNESPARCLVCGCEDLWRQKDFDQRLGVAIVGLGILLSTIEVAYWRPG